MKLSNVQIALIEAALNYDNRECQLDDNMSNLTSDEARIICEEHCVKLPSPETFHKHLNTDKNEIFKGLFWPEDIDERMDLEHDGDMNNELKLSLEPNGPWSRPKRTDANRRKIYGAEILWLTKDAINAYFDQVTPEQETEKSETELEIEKVEEEMKALQTKLDKLYSIRNLEAQVAVLKSEL